MNRLREPTIRKSRALSYLMMRSAAGEDDRHIYQSLSEDDGKIWTPPERTPMWGKPPNPVVLRSGAFALQLRLPARALRRARLRQLRRGRDLGHRQREDHPRRRRHAQNQLPHGGLVGDESVFVFYRYQQGLRAPARRAEDKGRQHTHLHRRQPLPPGTGSALYRPWLRPGWTTPRTRPSAPSSPPDLLILGRPRSPQDDPTAVHRPLRAGHRQASYRSFVIISNRAVRRVARPLRRPHPGQQRPSTGSPMPAIRSS